MEPIGEKCGVFGIYGEGLDVSRLTFFGLYSLQHRGQESSGIAATDGKRIICHKDTGLVSQVFNEEIISKLTGHIAVGHNRYSTSNGTGRENIQPIETDGTLVLAHNGNLPSTTLLSEFLEKRGILLPSCSDSKMVTIAINALMKDGASLLEAVRQIYPLMTGAFSILIMTKDQLIAIRDECGIRPFSLGKLNGGYVFASETCAFHPIGATFIRDVLPGEMIVVDKKGLRSEMLVEGRQKLDIFEFVYFSRPDSTLLGQSVHEVRKRFGVELAKQYSIEADVVIPVPETSIPVAIGFSNASGIPFDMGLVKSRYIHRTFIEPEQHIRDQGVKLKLAPLKQAIEGKRVVIVDDSIVRGTTSRQIVRMLFETGAKEVHFLISCPPVKFPDFYGIDLPKQSDLLAANKSVEEMRKYLGTTTLNFLSYEKMIKATELPEEMFCTACFTGKYPIDLRERQKEVVFESSLPVSPVLETASV